MDSPASMTPRRPLCSVLAREKGLDPIGYAGAADIFITFEMPLPWPYALWQSEAMPKEVRKLLEIWYGNPDIPRPRLRPLVIAPDPAWSRRGYRRVMIYRCPEGRFANFAKREYLIPEAELGPLVWALLMDTEGLAAFEGYLEPLDTRDFLICTHGAVDAACAKFGYPLYKRLSNLVETASLAPIRPLTPTQRSAETKSSASPLTTRIWRVSHFGGHVFAPTLLELPAGRFWAYVDGDKPERLLNRSGNAEDFYGHYRGWTGLETGFLQAAEREAFMREGWDWLDYPKAGKILTQDDAEVPCWAEVRLEFTNLQGESGAYQARVELTQPVETFASTRSEQPHSYRQYQVSDLARVPIRFAERLLKASEPVL